MYDFLLLIGWRFTVSVYEFYYINIIMLWAFSVYFYSNNSELVICKLFLIYLTIYFIQFNETNTSLVNTRWSKSAKQSTQSIHSYTHTKVYILILTQKYTFLHSHKKVYILTLTHTLAIHGNHINLFSLRFQLWEQKCSSESGGSKRSPDGRMANHVEMAQKYQLMDQAVQPITFSPLVMREHERCV